MNYSILKTRLALNAGNMASTHPYYSFVGNYINDSVRLFIMRASAKWPNFQLFPEHKDVEWTSTSTTTQDVATLAIPSDSIVPQRVFSLDSSTAPNLNNSNWRLLSYLEPEAYDQLNKSTANIAYPSNWTVREGSIYFYPTPRATKLTYVKVDGIEDEPDMVNGTDAPRTNVRWHPAILDFATYLLLRDIGWDEDAQSALAACDDKIATVGGAMADLRRANLKKAITIKGAPTFTA